MLKKSSNQFQIKSLQETTSTKKQVMEKLSSITDKELKVLVPGLTEKLDRKAIINSADKILEGEMPADFSDVTTEAIILAIGRPVFFVRNDKPELKGDEVEKWRNLLTNATQNLLLSNTISSIGRVELDNHPDYSWVGTAWVVAEDMIMTNRHVAKTFAENRGSTFRFKSFLNGQVVPRIDFLAEHKNEETAEFGVIACVYIAGDNEPDVAVFKINWNTRKEKSPLVLSDRALKAREDIAVIGYPAFDSRTTKVEDMERIYQKVYDVKRLAPGKITQVSARDGIGLHDATTLGGNSGSAIISLDTGQLVGLHFAGKEGFGNYFVTAPVLKKIISKLRVSRTVMATAPALSVADAVLAEMVPRQCALEPYTKIQVPSFKISGRIISFASPDSTYAVTRKMFLAAKKSILIGIYDLSAQHMLDCITDAMDRGVTVSLMLDIDSEKELSIFKKLKKYGVECVPAPSCASKNISYFASSHEKVIVIDNKWTFIQSGNYSNNSIPANEGDGDDTPGFKTGNRDMGVLIESAPMARYFTKVLKADMKLELEGAGLELMEERMPDTELLIEAPARKPDPLFPSKLFNPDTSITVQPVLSPDNYMDIIPDLLAGAKRSIRIEQQYIRVGQKHINKLLQSIPRDIEVQVILAHPIGSDTKAIREMQALQDEYGFEVRFLSKQFVHCHNKLIVVDDDKVLISSQNWSDSAVAKNREAGVIIYDKEITKYYSKIFDADWTMSEDSADELLNEIPVTGLEAYGANPGKFVRIDACDIQEV